MSILSNIDELAINLTNINGKEIELLKMFVDLEIYESIFNQFLHGKIILLDSMDLISNFPLIGNEDLNITIRTNQYDSLLSLNFKVYKLSKDEIISNKNKKLKILVLYFCSEELINNHLTSISRKFTQQKSEDIIQWLFTNTLETTKEFSFTESIELLDVYSNFWKSNKIIEYLCQHSKTSNYLDYIFFENIDGFNFKPLSELLAESSIQELVYESSKESFIKINNIRSYSFNSYFDILSLLKVGFFGSTLYKYDETEYLLTETESIFSDNENTFTSLGNNSLFDSNLSNKNNLMKDDLKDHDIENSRKTILKLLYQYNLVTKVNGDFTRKSGSIVNFSFPNIDNEEPVNHRFDGNWFIVSIKHSISQSTEYNQNLLLTKNAGFNDSNLPTISSLKNI